MSTTDVVLVLFLAVVEAIPAVIVGALVGLCGWFFGMVAWWDIILWTVIFWEINKTIQFLKTSVGDYQQLKQDFDVSAMEFWSRASVVLASHLFILLPAAYFLLW